LAKRRVLNPRDVSLVKYHSESVSKEKDAAAAKGEPTTLTRSLDKQWNKHGLTLRELLDLYNRHGSQAPAPVRDDLIKKCKQYGLSTSGDLWDLEKAILMYELASKQRMYGLPQVAINRVISALGDIQASVDSEEDDGGDDGDGKGKDTSDAGKKDASASPKGSKKGSRSPKGGKPDDAAKDGSKDESKDGSKDGKKDGFKDGKTPPHHRARKHKRRRQELFARSLKASSSRCPFLKTWEEPYRLLFHVQLSPVLRH
jgi:hypothetical protein